MAFLERFFENPFDEPSPVGHSNNSFETINQQQLEAHMKINKYDSFELTDAVRPAIDLKVKPVQGYRNDTYVDEATQARVPVVMAAASKSTLFPLFMDLIQRLGPVVDVVLETSHEQTSHGHLDMYREHIDLPVLTSILWQFEELLTNDGCTGIAILNPKTPQEIQFDEHKLLIVYGSPLEHYEHVMECHGVTHNDQMHFITEAEHIHSSTDQYAEQFEDLRTRLGLDQSR